MLPDTTDSLLFSCLSPQDLVSYSRTCKAAYRAVTSYKIRAFDINERLSRFFSPSEVLYFRYWQAQTGLFISGSTALQFFDRSIYPESDLDIYVEHRHALVVAQWLTKIGYTFVPRKNQQKGALESFDETPDAFNGFFPSAEVGYFGSGIAMVFNFHKYHPDRKIQLITALHSPMEVILNFHSTCVMNIITHDSAYALFPNATFEQRRSLICATEGSKQDEARAKARAKYRARGWTMETSLQSHEIRDRLSDFRMGNRWIGDKACWTIKILPDLGLGPDYIGSNTWRLAYSEGYEARNEFMILQSPHLRYRYLVADEDIAKFIDPAISQGLADKKFYDADINQLLGMYCKMNKRFRVNMQ